MTDQVKVLIAERNGVELPDKEELPLVAENVFLDSALFAQDNVQEALESLAGGGKRRFFIQYSLSAQLNFDEYLYPWNFDSNNGAKRSGNNSNGWQFFDSSPIVAPFNCKIVSGTFRNRGVAQSTGSPAASMTLRYDLYNVGVTGGQGTLISQINVTFTTAGKTIGNFWNSAVNTNLNESRTFDISGINQGDLLGLKFIRQTGNSNVVSIHNALVSLELEEVI